MGDVSAGIGIVLLLLVFLGGGMPIAFALLTAGCAGLVWVRGWAPVEFQLSTFFYSYTANVALIVLPLFLLMGNLAFSAGLSEKAFNIFRTVLARVPGGLAIGVVFGCAAFATVCGSSVATAVTMGRVGMPEMLKSGYKPWLASGCVAAGGTLGVLIPPSGILVVYSIATQVPITDLFIAAFVPGVMTAIIYAILIMCLVKINPDIAPSIRVARTSLPEKLKTLLGSWEIFLLFLVVMGTMYTGIATATEASAFGAFGALLIMMWHKRGAIVKTLVPALSDAAGSTATVFALILGAGLFGVAIATTHVATLFADFMIGLGLPDSMLIVVLLVPFLVLGCFVDGVSLILLTMPIIFPIVQSVGFSPVLFGLLVTKMVEIGAITPPVGLNAFAVKGVAPQVPLSDIFKGCLPFVLVELGIVLLLLMVPEISLFLLDAR